MEPLERFIPTQDDIDRYKHFGVNAGLCYRNDIYEVIVCHVDGYDHIKIHRIDDKPIPNYMDFQEIKNFVFGKEATAVEVYPRQSDFKDGSNTYHLWSWDGIEDNVPNLALMPKYS